MARKQPVDRVVLDTFQSAVTAIPSVDVVRYRPQPFPNTPVLEVFFTDGRIYNLSVNNVSPKGAGA